MDNFKFSPEELDSFNELFASDAIDAIEDLPDVSKLSVTTQIPGLVAKLLGNSKLSLLAEVSHYKFFFPLKLRINEFGQFCPELGIPEVLDTRGCERSWRLTNLDGVVVKSIDDGALLEVLSLSSSGVTLRELEMRELEMRDNRAVQLELPDGQALPMAVEEVRNENGVVAARIMTSGEANEALRRFLFGRHKDLYSELYADLAMPKFELN